MVTRAGSEFVEKRIIPALLRIKTWPSGPQEITLLAECIERLYKCNNSPYEKGGHVKFHVQESHRADHHWCTNSGFH